MLEGVRNPSGKTISTNEQNLYSFVVIVPQRLQQHPKPDSCHGRKHKEYAGAECDDDSGIARASIQKCSGHHHNISKSECLQKPAGLSPWCVELLDAPESCLFCGNCPDNGGKEQQTPVGRKVWQRSAGDKDVEPESNFDCDEIRKRRQQQGQYSQIEASEAKPASYHDGISSAKGGRWLEKRRCSRIALRTPSSECSTGLLRILTTAQYILATFGSWPTAMVLIPGL